MKKIKLLGIVLIILTSHNSFAQKYLCKDGNISFFSETPVENIEAKSNECSSALDSKTGELVFVVPITSFKFEKSLMQEHFNENYMESEKYPKAFFKGKIADPSVIDYKKDGTYAVSAQGKLTIHNVTRDVNIPGTVTIKNGKAVVDSKFKVRCADYKIKIPKVVMVKIAEEIEVTLSNTLNPI
jgi:polyisoprenoid-binding protein YceI